LCIYLTNYNKPAQTSKFRDNTYHNIIKYADGNVVIPTTGVCNYVLIIFFTCKTFSIYFVLLWLLYLPDRINAATSASRVPMVFGRFLVANYFHNNYNYYLLLLLSAILLQVSMYSIIGHIIIIIIVISRYYNILYPFRVGACRFGRPPPTHVSPRVTAQRRAV